MKKIYIYKTLFFLFLVLFIFLTPLLFSEDYQQINTDTNLEAVKKKVLYVDSYHRGYPWSDGITSGVLNVFGARLNDDDSVNNEDSLVDLRIARMDTKRNTNESFKRSAALKVKNLIEQWKPDVVIASDDNASKYLISKYYKNKQLPFVFCGVNQDASQYGFPCRNITGMIEVALYRYMLKQVKLIRPGNRIGYIAADTLSERHIYDRLKSISGYNLINTRFVKTFAQWKKAFVDVQKDVDYLVFINYAGILDWDKEEAIKHIQKNTRVLTIANDIWMADYVTMVFGKVSREQGEWSARTALDILGGKSPAQIDVVTNKESSIILNMDLANRLGVKFPIDLLDRSHFVHEIRGNI